MKKAFIFSMLFVLTLAFSAPSMASTQVLNVTSTVLVDVDDEDPKKAETKSECAKTKCSKAKTECTKTEKAACDKTAKKSCCKKSK